MGHFMQLRILICIALMLDLVLIINGSIAQTNFWKQTNGPYGGQVGPIAINQANEVFAATSNGVHRSTDYGASWSRTLLTTGDVACFTVTSRGYVFAGTYSNSRTIYRSTDGGESWDSVHQANSAVMALLSVPNGELYAGTYFQGVYRSTDNGATWDSLGLRYVQALALDSSGNIYAGTNSAVYRSSDKGRTWIQTGLVTISVQSIVVTPNGDVVAGSGAAYRSSDHGVTWSQIGLPGSFVLSLAVNSAGDIFAATSPTGGVYGGGIHRLLHNDTVFNKVNNSSFNSVAVAPDGGIYAGGDGIYRSADDGISWVQTPLNNVSVYSLATHPTGQVLASTYPDGVFRSTDHGSSWTRTGLDHDVVSVFAFSNNGTIFGATYGGLIYRSTDTGGTWEVTDKTLVYWSTRFNALVTTANGYLFAGATRNISPCPCGQGVYRSTDNGGQWHPTNLTPGIWSMATNVQGDLFAASDSLYRSTDYGDTWTNASIGLTVPLVGSLASSSDGFLFAGTSAGMFRSTDDGDHWMASGLTNLSVKAIAIHPQETIFAGTDSGMFISHDHGETWKQEISGLTQTMISSLTVDSSGYVYCGTVGGGIFRSAQTVSAVIDPYGSLPKSYLLAQNYPNPFNPATTIEFSLPYFDLVVLRVFNLLGEEVTTLVSQKLSPGYHRVQWDAGRSPSGIYFYRLQAGSFSETKKLLLLR